MKSKIMEVNNTNRFIVEEVPGSIGMRYVPEKIKKHFNIKSKNGVWVHRKKEQEKR